MGQQRDHIVIFRLTRNHEAHYYGPFTYIDAFYFLETLPTIAEMENTGSEGCKYIMPLETEFK